MIRVFLVYLGLLTNFVRNWFLRCIGYIQLKTCKNEMKIHWDIH